MIVFLDKFDLYTIPTSCSSISYFVDNKAFFHLLIELLRDYSFSTSATFSHKLTFLTPRFALYELSENFTYVLNE